MKQHLLVLHGGNHQDHQLCHIYKCSFAILISRYVPFRYPMDLFKLHLAIINMRTRVRRPVGLRIEFTSRPSLRHQQYFIGLYGSSRMGNIAHTSNAPLPDLTPMDFFLQGSFKKYQTRNDSHYVPSATQKFCLSFKRVWRASGSYRDDIIFIK